MRYYYDNDFAKMTGVNQLGTVGLNLPLIPVGDIEGRRQLIREAISRRSTEASRAVLKGIDMTDHEIISSDGSKIRLRWYKKKDSHTSVSKSEDRLASPSVLYLHGGGLISGSIDDFDSLVAFCVLETSVPFLAVDYRLAPEHPYPAAVEDSYAALVWLHQNAAELHIDPARIAIMGSSSGAGLAACTCLLARIRSGPAIAKQILISPMLDSHNVKPGGIPTDCQGALAPMLTWTWDDNATGWAAYLGGSDSSSREAAETAAAGAMKDANGMPELYLDIGGLDIFLSEGVEYASKHIRAGIPVELHVHPGLPHSFEGIAPQAAVSERARLDRLRAIRNIRPCEALRIRPGL